MFELQYCVIGIVQGITEFLPISSSGHLVLISELTNWQDQGIFTDVAVHVGTLLAVIIYLRNNIFILIKNFFILLKDDNWLTSFIFWELNVYKSIGYDINFKNYVKNITLDGNKKFIVESTNKIIPNFLINNKLVPSVNDIVDGFKIVGDFLEKTILRPNNINFPSSRVKFGNLIKRT